MRLDADIKEMSAGSARRELQRLRSIIRRHRGLDENARCWHADLELYAKTLPEAEPAGKMTLPEKTLLVNCKRYIRRQQCGPNCPNATLGPKTMLIWLPIDKAQEWVAGEEGWWLPVKYYTSEMPGHKEVYVPSSSCHDGMFHPDEDDDILGLAEMLS